MELDAARLPPPSKGPLQLRRAMVDDIDDFVHIMVTALQHDEAEISQSKQNTAEQFRDPYRKSYLADLYGKPIGGLEVFLVSKESRVFINSLGVLPEYQRRGYGRQILTETLNALVADGSEHVMIEVQTDNRQGLSLYHCSWVR